MSNQIVEEVGPAREDDIPWEEVPDEELKKWARERMLIDEEAQFMRLNVMEREKKKRE